MNFLSLSKYKSLVGLIIFFKIAQIGFSQKNFEYIIDTEGKSYCNDIKCDEKGNTIIIANQLTPTYHNYDLSYLIRVSSEGDTLIKLINCEDTLVYLHEIELININKYAIFGSWGLADSVYPLKKTNHLFVICVDSSLNIISQKKFKLAWEYWNPYYFTSLASNGKIYAGGYCHYYLNYLDYKHMFMAIFTADGDTVCTKYPDLENLSVGSHTFESALEAKDSPPGITLFGDGFISGSWGQFIEIDSSLNYTYTEAGFPDNFSFWWSSMRKLDDDHYLYTTSANPYNKDLEDDVMVMKMNAGHQCEDYILLNRPDTNDYPAWRRAIDYVYKDKIYVTGHQEHFIADPVNSNIFVYLIDSALNIHGMKYYGGEMNYSILTLAATPDGGCVLAGSVYDWQNSPPDVVDLWIKKVMPGEIITHAEETPDAGDFDVVIWPNPVKELLNINTIRKNLVMLIYSTSGNPIKQIIIEGSLNQKVPVEDMAKGIYLYKIFDNQVNIQNGRIIKL